MFYLVSFIIAKKEGLQVDLIIGNPPFNIETGKKKGDVIKPAVLSQLNFKHKVIPNNNFALHFFEVAMLFSKEVCLIIPANVLLLQQGSARIQKAIFYRYTIKKNYDFTHLRESLFTKKTRKNIESQLKNR